MKFFNFLFILVFISTAFGDDYVYQYYSAGNDYKAITIADYDSDGANELWAGNWSNDHIEIWSYNNNNDSMYIVDEITGLPYDIWDIAVDDLDGDGDMDAVAALRSSGTYLCINNDSLWNVSRIDGSYGWQVILEDFDLDNNLDILSCTDWSYLKIFYGDGTGNFTEGAAPSSAQNYGDSKGMNAIDVNNDARPDIIGFAGEWMSGGDNQYFLRVYTNTDTGGIAWSASIGPKDTLAEIPKWVQSYSHSAGDLNEDGFIDQVGVTIDSLVIVAFGGMQGDSLIWAIDTLDRYDNNIAVATIFDINKDSYLDILVSGSNYFNGLYIYYGDGSGTFQKSFLDMDHGFGTFHTLKAGDINGNGSTDIVGSRYKTYEDGFAVYFNKTQISRLYVNSSASGSGSGLTWENACVNLQEAFKKAGAETEIWVAAGTYYPDSLGTGAGPRTSSFVIPDSVSLYGGFNGSELELCERDWETNLTILSGDLGTTTEISDNAYHVLKGSNDNILDGFIITEGNSYGDTGEEYGGGMLNKNGRSITIANCIFKDNNANEGAGIENYFCSNTITITNCQFKNNNANHGAGIASHDTPTKISRCLFEADTVSGYGAAIYNWGAVSDAHIIHCTFYANSSGDSTGGTVHCRASGIETYIINSIFWGNSDDIALTHSAITYVHYSCIGQSGYAGANNNINIDPDFIDAANGDFHLSANSACIDSGTAFFAVGSDTLINSDTTMYKGSAPDMGVYESSYTVAISDKIDALPDKFTLFQNYPNPFNPQTSIPFFLPESGNVRFEVYNILGELVFSIQKRFYSAGHHLIQFKPDIQASSVYIYRIQAGKYSDTRKMIFIK